MIRALLVIVLALVTALGWSLWRAEAHKGDAAAAEVAKEAAEKRGAELAAELGDVKGVLATERTRANGIAAISSKTQQELSDAQDRATRLAGELATGERRVRHEIAALYTARLSSDAAAARELDAAAQRGAELVAAAVGVGARCDIVQRGLIDAYELNRLDREKTP